MEINKIFIEETHTRCVLKIFIVIFTYPKEKNMRFSISPLGVKNHFQTKSVLDLNHLGNVLSVVSDRKIAVETTTGSNTISHYKPEILSATDFYPFGMPMGGSRSFQSSTGYRYGMNGQEKVDEISGDGNHYTAEYWEYDTRLGRRWNIDPVTKYWRSSYDAFDNCPIWKIDPNGDDDFFNKDGSYSHSTKEGTAIKIITQKGNVLLHEYGTYDVAHRKALGNIATYYGKMEGVKGNVGILNSNEGTKSSENPAYTHGGNIYLNSKDGISPALSDRNSLLNVLHHEKDHQDGKALDKGSFEHLDIYLQQTKEESYKKSPQSFKDLLKGGTIKMLNKLATNELQINGSLDKTMEFVNKYNENSKNTGTRIEVKRFGQQTTGDSSDDKVIISTYKVKK